MPTNNENFKIKDSEIAATLGWKYSTTLSIKERKSPPDKFEKYLECKKKLENAKKKVIKELIKN